MPAPLPFRRPSVPARVSWRGQVLDGRRRGEADLALVAALLGPGDGFVDVGANAGLYVAAALLRHARVLAAEAHPGLAAGLADRFGGVADVRHVAVASGVGPVELHVPSLDGRPVLTRSSVVAGANPGYATTAVTVPSAPLDALVDRFGPIAVVKIDVEGAEADVLASAAATLARRRPAVVVEIEARHHPDDPDAAHRLLADAGYRGYFRDPGRRRGMERTRSALVRGSASGRL